MVFATTYDVQRRMQRAMSADERKLCAALLEDAGTIISAAAPNAREEACKVVSCRMVIRALGDGNTGTVPVGASQGSMSGLGYTQSWTINSGGSTGELYLSKQDRQLLGKSNAIGSYSPVQELAEVES